MSGHQVFHFFLSGGLDVHCTALTTASLNTSPDRDQRQPKFSLLTKLTSYPIPTIGPTSSAS